MVKQRKMIQSNLLKNSISAYFAAIEIHNKPNIAYRYETVTLLLMNAWELLLKVYIRKFIKSRSIFEDNGHTIPISKAIVYVDEHINTIKSKAFWATRDNLFCIEEYRNNIAHFYQENLEPQIFMLVARAALNYVEFMKQYFGKDIIQDEGLFIMPLGFKLPFRPEDFLTKKAIAGNTSKEAQKFMHNVIGIIKDLKDNDVEESIVLGFDIFLESVKKASNSDLLIAITNQDDADASFTKTTNIRITNDPNAPAYSLSDEQFREQYPYNHNQLIELCKKNIHNFSANKEFNQIKRNIVGNVDYVGVRRLDSKNPKSSSQKFYSDKAISKIKVEYEKLFKEETPND